MASNATYYRRMKQACDEMISIETDDNLPSERIDFSDDFEFEGDDFLEKEVQCLSNQISHRNSDSDEIDFEDYYSFDEMEEASETESRCNQDDLLQDAILHFVITFNLPRRATQHLLNLLLRFGIAVPKSVYHLQKNLMNNLTTLNQLGSGLFTYISLRDNIKFCFENGLLSAKKGEKIVIDCRVNMDGLPLYRSSSESLWPILVLFEGISFPFPVAIYYGKEKANLNDYLREFVEEVKLLKTSGFTCCGEQIFIGRMQFVCDSVARAYVQGVNGHTAAKGCPYCRCNAQRILERMVYPTTVSPKRTDDGYRSFSEDNQIVYSPLAEIAGLYKDVPVDYQHCVCLGVMRKLLLLYCRPVKSYRSDCRLRKEDLKLLSDDIEYFRKFTPSEFQRRPRRFDTDLLNYKASELRSILLYFGPFLLKKYLPEKFFLHFLKLHFAMYIFTSNRYKEWFACANRCLEIFVSEMPALFGPHSVTHNMHLLLHLHEFVLLNGSVDRFSAFPFENHLGLLKRRVRQTNGVLQHARDQLMKIREILATKPTQRRMKFSVKYPDNCALVRGHFILVKCVSGEIVSGNVLLFRRDLYSHPYSSRNLHIGYYVESFRSISGVPDGKAILFPLKSEFVLLPLASNPI